MKETERSIDQFGNKTKGLGFLFISAIFSGLSPYTIQGTMLSMVEDTEMNLAFRIP